MGIQDNWHTPKQLKIERAGEPRPPRRFRLKRGQRRKGKKARLDEIISSRKTLMQYAEWMTAAKARAKNVQTESCFDRSFEHWFNDHVKKHTKLLAAAVKDGIITWAPDWWVWKP